MSTIFFDFNNLCVRCLFSKDVINEQNEIDWELGEYRIISSLISSLFYQRDLEDLILAQDGKKSGRKEVFPSYKEERKDKREKGEINGTLFFNKMNELSKDISNFIPFKLIHIENAEADDVIATLVMNLPGEKTIVSSDYDFIQLLRDDIYLYDPRKKQFIDHPDPEIFLQEQILMGQNKHSIPNVKTPLDGPKQLRKPGFGPKTCEKVFIRGIDKFLADKVTYTKSYKDENGKSQIYKGVADLQERYEQNKQVMDLRMIPKEVKKSIIEAYNNGNYPNPDKIYKFFKDRNWSEFLDDFTRLENKLLELYKNENKTIELYV